MDSDEENNKQLFVIDFEYKYVKMYYHKLLHLNNVIKLVC